MTLPDQIRLCQKNTIQIRIRFEDRIDVVFDMKDLRFQIMYLDLLIDLFADHQKMVFDKRFERFQFVNVVVLVCFLRADPEGLDLFIPGKVRTKIRMDHLHDLPVKVFHPHHSHMRNAL